MPDSYADELARRYQEEFPEHSPADTALLIMWFAAGCATVGVALLGLHLFAQWLLLRSDVIPNCPAVC